jgi:hypothetical protein
VVPAGAAARHDGTAHEPASGPSRVQSRRLLTDGSNGRAFPCEAKLCSTGMGRASPSSTRPLLKDREQVLIMLQWVDVAPDAIVVATTTGAQLHRPLPLSADPFKQPMRGAGDAATTHWLLEGAIAQAGHSFSGQHSGSAVARGEPAPDGCAAERWAYRLAGYFHTTFATRRLLPAIARRFARAGRRELADWAEQKASQEIGHDELSLRDLSELGYQARSLVQAVLPTRAKAWVSLFEGLAVSSDPVGSVGYAHALERLALLRGDHEIRAIEGALPNGVQATRCLRVHSALGSDTAHVRANVLLTAALGAAERRAIARACYLTARIYFDPACAARLPSFELQALLKKFRVPRTALAERLTTNPNQVGGSDG